MVLGIGTALDQAWLTLLEALNVNPVSQSALFKLAVLLVVGFVGGRILSEVLRRVLKMTRLDDLAVQSDLQTALREVNYRGSVSDFIADLVRWMIYLVTLLSTFYFARSALLIQYSETAINWASQLFVAAIMFTIGILIAERVEHIVVRVLRSGRVTGRVDESRAAVPFYRVVGIAAKYVGYLLTLLFVMEFLGVDTFLVNAVIVIVALGAVALLVVSSRYVVRNVAISFYLQLSNTFTAGDRIRVDGYSGTVQAVHPLYTKVRGDDGAAYFIPNTVLVSDVVTREGG